MLPGGGAGVTPVYLKFAIVFAGLSSYNSPAPPDLRIVEAVFLENFGTRKFSPFLLICPLSEGGESLFFQKIPSSNILTLQLTKAKSATTSKTLAK